MSSSTWRTRTFSSLDNPNYRKFFTAQAISLTGTWMQSVAMAWLVLELTHSATWLGLTIALQFVPVLLLGPYGGVIIDRLDKRRLIIGTNCAAALQALSLGLLYQTHRATLSVVLVLTVLLGLTNVLDNPARQSFVREMVKDDQVRNAVSLNFGLVTSAMGIGAIAGGLVSASRSHFGIGPLTTAVFAFAVADLLVALAPTIELASLALVGVGAASIWFLSTGNATLQMSAVPEMRGRVMALWAVAFLGTTPIGGPVIGFIAQSWGARWALAVGAVSAFAAGTLGLSAMRRHARMHGSALQTQDPVA